MTAKKNAAPKQTTKKATKKTATKNLSNDSTVTIDGVEYKMSALSAEAKAQLQRVQVVDAEINRLTVQAAIANTARSSYLAALQAALPKK